MTNKRKKLLTELTSREKQYTVPASYAYMHMSELIDEIEEHYKHKKVAAIKNVANAIIDEFTALCSDLDDKEEQAFYQNLDLDIKEIVSYISVLSMDNLNQKLCLPMIEEKTAILNDTYNLDLKAKNLFKRTPCWPLLRDELDEIQFNFAYDKKDVDPLLILQKLVVSYSFIIQPDVENNLWRYRFTDKDAKIKDNDIHSCNTLTSLLDEIKGFIMPILIKDLKECGKHTYYLDPQPKEEVDFDYIQNLSNTALYAYLVQFTSVRLNVSNLKYLYFFLNYTKIGFDHPTVMKRTKKWLLYNFDNDKELSINLQGEFLGYKYSIKDVPGVNL